MVNDSIYLKWSDGGRYVTVTAPHMAAHEMIFGQLILKKIIKIVATRCHILRLKCI